MWQKHKHTSGPVCVDQNGLLAEMEGKDGDAVEAMDTEEAEQPEKMATGKPALRMSFAEYRKISNLLVLHMQKMDQCWVATNFYPSERKSDVITDSLTGLRALEAV